MSLIPSANAGAPGQDYFIDNLGTNAAPIVPATTIALTGDAQGRAYVRGANPAAAAQPGSLHLGANPDVFDSIVLTSGPALTTINTNTIVTNGSQLALTNAIDATGSAVANGGTLNTYCNRDIHGFSDTGYAVFSVAGAGGGAIANPGALSDGLHAVTLVGAGPGNEQAQPSGVFYRAGGVWTGNAVSFAFTAGAPNCAITPAAGGATLSVGGAAIPANYNVIFRQLLATP